VSYRLGIVVGVSPQHPDAIIALFGFDLLLIQGEMTIAFDFEKTTIAFITDQTLVSAAKLLL